MSGHSQLSPAQRRVVEHPLELPGVVAAGAGTGKTHTIVERVAWLHNGGICPARRVLLLTFGRKAAAELRMRIMRRLGEDAPNCLTFHAFAWQILSSHAYDIGLAPESAVLEDADARVEFSKAFDEYLGDENAPPSGFPLRTINRDEIRASLFALDQRLKQDGVSLDRFRERALAAADAFGAVRYRTLRKAYNAKYKGQTHKEIAAVSNAGLAQEVEWEKQRVESCTSILRRFAQRLRARAALTYGDLLGAAVCALREQPALAAQLGSYYQACIVDEYQDTDLAQHRLLEAIFGEGLARVMVVGDRLQSIFSFRGAHPENVTRFERAPNSAVYTLLENRRSRQEILDVAHALVCSEHPQADKLEAERGAAGEQIVHVSSLWGSRLSRPSSFDEGRELEAAAVAARILELRARNIEVDELGGRAVLTWRHIAILSRTKRNVQPLTEALLAAGIPFKLVGGVGFYDAPEIRDVVAWLRLLADPFDSFSVARALQSPAIGASDAAVARLAAGTGRDPSSFAKAVLAGELPPCDAMLPPRDATRSVPGATPPARDAIDSLAAAAAAELRRRLDELAPHAALPLSSALRAVLEVTGTLRYYQDSDDPQAPQARANLVKLEALARSFAESTPGAHSADFVAFLSELESVDFDEREADVSGADAVTIATIHAAKGLEWPIVFVTGIWPQLPAGARLQYDARNGALLYAQNPDGSRAFHFQASKLAADDRGEVAREEDREDKSEERRLLYVAITRARDRVFLSGVRRKPSKNNPDGSAHHFVAQAYAWLKGRTWEGDDHPQSASLPAALGIDRAPRGAAQPEPFTPPGRSLGNRAARSRLVVAQPAGGLEPGMTGLPLSYSLIARFDRCPRQATYKRIFGLPEVGQSRGLKTYLDFSEQAADAGAAAVPDSPLGAGDYGLLVHASLEGWAKDKMAGVTTRPASLLIAEATELLGLRPAPQQRSDAQAAIDAAARELSAWQPLLVEAPFMLDFGNDGATLLVTGFLDLLARNGQGEVCLLDYKTGAPAVDHALQLGLYREAARAVYGFEATACFIAHLDGKRFTLEAIEPAELAVVKERVVAVGDGLAAADDHAKAGAWCLSCGYRAAPCLDYVRTGTRRG